MQEEPNNLKGRFCGNNNPGSISGKGALTFKFESDASVQKSGFRVTWVTHECGGRFLFDNVDILSL